MQRTVYCCRPRCSAHTQVAPPFSLITPAARHWARRCIYCVRDRKGIRRCRRSSRPRQMNLLPRRRCSARTSGIHYSICPGVVVLVAFSVAIDIVRVGRNGGRLPAVAAQLPPLGPPLAVDYEAPTAKARRGIPSFITKPVSHRPENRPPKSSHSPGSRTPGSTPSL